MTHRIEPIFFGDSIEHWFWSRELSPSFWTRLKENELHFLGMWLQRIEPDFTKMYDSKNWTLFTRRLKELNPLGQIWHKELNPFLNMTHRRTFLRITTQRFFLWNMPHKTQRIEPSFLFKCDSKNWTFFQFDSKKKHYLDRIEPSFGICLNELNLFFQHES